MRDNNRYSGSIYDNDDRIVTDEVPHRARRTKKLLAETAVETMKELTKHQIRRYVKVMYDQKKLRMQRKARGVRAKMLRVKQRNIQSPPFCPVFPDIRLNYRAIARDGRKYIPTEDDHPVIVRLYANKQWRGHNVRIVSYKAAKVLRHVSYDQLKLVLAFFEEDEKQRKMLKEERLAKKRVAAQKPTVKPMKAARPVVATAMPKPRVAADVREPDELVRIAGVLYGRFGDTLIRVPEH